MKVSSDGVPILAGQNVSVRVVQTSGVSQTFPKVRFGIATLEPKGSGGLLLPELGPGGGVGGWEPVDTQQVYVTLNGADIEARRLTFELGSEVDNTVLDPQPIPNNPYTFVDDQLNSYTLFRYDMYKYDENLDLVWHVTVGDGGQRAAVVSNDGSRIYGGSDTNKVVTYDGSNGAVLDETAETGGDFNFRIWSVTANKDGEMVAGLQNGYTVKFNADGTIAWTYINPNQTSLVRGVAIDPATSEVYAGSQDSSFEDVDAGTLNKISADGTATIWSNREEGRNLAISITPDAVFRGGQSDPFLERLLPSDGSSVWRTNHATEGVDRLWADPNGALYTQTSAGGVVRRLNQSDGAEVWSQSLGNGYLAPAGRGGKYDFT